MGTQRKQTGRTRGARDEAGGEGRRLVLDSYARLSKMPGTNDLEKVEDQHADNRRVIERMGAVLGKELDDGLSAWNKNVRRKDWEELLERVESGASDGVVVWHTDRLFRQPRDLEKLIDLADAGFVVASAHGARNLGNPDDRFILRIEVAHAARSSDDTSRRLKRRFEGQRMRGIVHRGNRSFGFAGTDMTIPKPEPIDGVEQLRPQISVAQVERERQALRDGTKAALAGLSLRKIGEGWTAASIFTTGGHPFGPITVRAVLARPRNAGLVEHNGEIVATMPGESIVTREDFERLSALFASRRRGRVAGDVYTASGYIHCGRCGTKMGGRRHGPKTADGRRKYAQYYCYPARGGCGKTGMSLTALEKELRAFVIDRLSDSRHAASVSAARARVADRLGEVNRELAACKAIQQGLSDRLGRRELDLDAFDNANLPLVADIARLTAERTALSGGNPDGPTTAMSAEQVAAEWDDGNVSERRALLKSALGSTRIVVDLPKFRGNRADADRLRIVPPGQPLIAA